MNQSLKIDTKHAIISIILSIFILIAAQLISLLIGEGITVLGTPSALGNVIAAFLYPALTLLGLKLLCNKLLKLSLADCGISSLGLNPIWGISAVLMPALVIVSFLFIPGHWENPLMTQAQLANALTGAILFTGFAVGIVEEAVFRGVIMKVLEVRWNKWVAVLVPSMIFGALHVIGADMDLLSFLQLLIAGSVVGILFSLVTYESGSIWPNAFMHSVWNMCMGTGILYISNEMSENSIFNYVLETNSFLISGGDFGIEASCISIAAYAIFIILAIVLLRQKKPKH